MMSTTFGSYDTIDYEGTIVAGNNLTLCNADYFQVCWCPFNSTQSVACPYLLRHVVSSSNSSHFCVYHVVRKIIDCIDSSSIFPTSSKITSPSNIYLYVTLLLFIIGLIGNGTSMIILFKKSLRRLCIYKNLMILCAFNILYLTAIFVRHRNSYKRDIRDVSPNACRLHSFLVACLGHLCSWQLVSTSVQRVHALLSLETNRKISWVRTFSLLLIFVVIPTFIFDAQLLFGYGLFRNREFCTRVPVQQFPNILTYSAYEIKQFRRAIKFPINSSTLRQNSTFRYHLANITTPSTIVTLKPVCIIWNMCDAFVYAILPFIITLVCSIVIIVKVCERRHSMIVFGGTRHVRRQVIIAQDHLSILLIAINFLFLIMTSPFNILLIVQSFYQRCSSSTFLLLTVSECFRSLQNSYHALAFVFYCVIGNKFRNSAWSICGTIYYELIKLGIEPRCSESILILFSCCNQRRRSTISTHTMTTTTKLAGNDIVNQAPIVLDIHAQQQRKRSSFVLVRIKQPSSTSIDAKQRRIVQMITRL